MNADTTMNPITEDQIARCAYDIWEREGRPCGRDLEHWLQAEALLQQGASSSAATRPPLSARPRRSGSKAANGKREKKFEMVS
jgi:hypothetical protein